MSDEKTITISGRERTLSDGKRKVMVGYSDDLDGVLIRFSNEIGEQTKLRLSEEAADALTSLLTRRRRGGAWKFAYEDAQWELVQAPPP
jgi:hypothetical protein